MVVAPKRSYHVGVAFKMLETKVKLGLAQSCWAGTRRAVRWIPIFYKTVKGFFTRSVSPRHVGGPVGIARVTYHAAKEGPSTLILFVGVISINLALLNLLPIPVLDGGHILFAGIEKVKGSPVSERVQTAIAYVGLALLVTLLLFATFNDVVRMFAGP